MQNEIVVTGEMVVDEAMTWMDTPFHHQAASKHHGCDCIGLVRGVGRDLEIMDFDEHSKEGRELLAYSMYPEPRRLIGALNYYFVRIHEHFEPGDVVLFAVDNQPAHVALVANVSKGCVIHTWLAANKVCETRYGRRLQPSGVWRYPGVAYPVGKWAG